MTRFLMTTFAELTEKLQEIRGIAEEVGQHDGAREVEMLRATLHRSEGMLAAPVEDVPATPAFLEWKDGLVQQCEIVTRLIDRHNEFPQRGDFKAQLMNAAIELAQQSAIGELALSLLLRF